MRQMLMMISDKRIISNKTFEEIISVVVLDSFRDTKGVAINNFAPCAVTEA